MPAASGTGLIKKIILNGGTSAGPVTRNIFYSLTAFRTKILAGKNWSAAIRAGLQRSFFFPHQRITATLAKVMLIAVNGMTLRADSHNGLFLIVKLCQRAVFSKLSDLEDINVNKEKIIYIQDIIFPTKIQDIKIKKLTCQPHENTIKRFSRNMDGSLGEKLFSRFKPSRALSYNESEFLDQFF